MKVQLMTARGIPEALSNLWYGNECDIATFQDAIEDSKNAEDLVRRINGLKIFRKFTLSRETDSVVRLKGIDCWGNVSYLVIHK